MARKQPRSRDEPSPPRPPQASGTDVHAQIADLRRQLSELRELVVELMHHQGLERAGARGGGILLSDEERIPLSAAVAMIWGKAAARTGEGVATHTGILKLWATRGMNGEVLETEARGEKWFTTREAVERFKAAALQPPGQGH